MTFDNLWFIILSTNIPTCITHARLVRPITPYIANY
nr:MAG TPA: hypothetical protein [Caudoviricetes sp.]